MPIEFGTLIPCRYCHGHGERVVAATPEEKREHERQKRRDIRNGDITERMPNLKRCPDCKGEGYVPPSHNMFR